MEVINKSKSLPLPKYETKGSDGFDFRACFDSGEKAIVYSRELGKLEVDLTPEDTTIVLSPGERALIPTGLFIALPEGFRLHVTPRSGLALKNGITVLNTPGKVDSDYRGGIGIIIINHGFEDFVIKHNDRIAQGAIELSCQLDWVEVETLSETERGEGGFGHTGRDRKSVV